MVYTSNLKNNYFVYINKANKWLPISLVDKVTCYHKIPVTPRRAMEFWE